MRDDTLTIGFSKRTLQRDIREIRNIFGIDIEFSASQKGYFISQSEYENMSFQRMIEAFDLFNSLNLAQDLKPFIHLEKRKPQGTENIYGLLHAIKNRLQIEFRYMKFWENEAQNRIVDPYALKEFKNRWYILAKDLKDGLLKSFALDRLSDLTIMLRSFEYPKSIDIEEYYRYCFGIVSPNNMKPSEIVLSFDPYQGKYIKSLPLHDTQEILVDNKDELRIMLKVCITYDFIMELLSFGGDVRVIKPKSLINIVKEGHEKGYKIYQD
jgi:predicted DNA-binding transcriptional regulator YafY